MSQILDIQRVAVGPRHVTARVRVADDAPLTTDQDLVGTTRVYNLMPEICDHACLGDEGATFRDALPATEVAHLFEHVAVELMARSGLAGDISCGRARELPDGDGRTFEVQVDCPDDVLAVGALSSAAWIVQWAYSGGGDPEPSVDATVQGLVGLVASLPSPDAPEADDADLDLDEPGVAGAPEAADEPSGDEAGPEA